MRRLLLIGGLIAQVLTTTVAAAQPGITFTFSEGRFSEVDGVQYVDFDVLASSSASALLGNTQLYLRYESAVFGENVAAAGAVSVAPGVLVSNADVYGIGFTDNTTEGNTTLSITADFKKHADATAGTQIGTTPAALVHVRMRLAQAGSTVTVRFDDDCSAGPCMTGQQFQSDGAAFATVSATTTFTAAPTTGSFPPVTQNTPPATAPDAAATMMNTEIVIDVLANDSDDGALDRTALALVAPPSHGTAVVQPETGTIVYMPTAGYTGTDLFSYTVKDDEGASSDEESVTITITEYSQDPVAEADHVQVDEDTPATIAVLANDSMPEQDTVELSVADTTLEGGRLALTETNEISYHPPADFFGTDSFTYTLRTSTGATAQAAVTVTVRPVNDAPRFRAAFTLQPTDGSDVFIGGGPDGAPAAPETPFVVSWGEAYDVDGDSVRYVWQLASTQEFGDILMSGDVGASTKYETDYEQMAGLLVETGLKMGASLSLFHRVIASDGALSTSSDAAEVTLVRGALTSTQDGSLPDQLALHQNYPNPFNPSTTIRYALPEASNVSLRVYNALGAEVMTLVSGQQFAGEHEITLDASDLASGIYLYRLEAGGQAATKTFILAK